MIPGLANSPLASITRRDVRQTCAGEPGFKQGLHRLERVAGRSWTELRLDELARKVGLEKFYASCALWPTMQIHSTRAGLDARLEPAGQDLLFTHGPQPDHADYALRYAHDLTVYLLNALNDYFGWGFDIRTLAQDCANCWSEGLAGESTEN